MKNCSWAQKSKQQPNGFNEAEKENTNQQEYDRTPVIWEWNALHTDDYIITNGEKGMMKLSARVK